MMRRVAIGFAMTATLAPWVRAQTHVVKKPETVVRAVAVYEWTGPEEKPTGSRLVPVSIFIDAQLRDAGVYLARPVPFALDVGTVFEMEKAGAYEGTMDVAFQRHLESSDTAPFDDGWLAYGILKPVAAPGTEVATKQRGPLPQIVASGGKKPQFASKTDDSTTSAAADPNRPTMTRRTGSSDTGSGTASGGTSGGGTTASTDSNKPVLQKRGDQTSATTDSTTTDSSTASDDPNRPVLERRPNSSAPDDSTTQPASTQTPQSSTPSSTNSRTSSTTDSADSSDASERPTLKRRTPTETQAKNPKRQGDVASVQSVGQLNDDPDRPTLHRGTTAALDIPPLEGLPADMKQMVAVSDAKDRPVHSFARPWETDLERAEVLAKMQELARARLATYDVPAPGTGAPGNGTSTAATSKTATAGKTRKPVAAAPSTPALAELGGESLHSYTLSYGGAATFIYTATSPGTKGATRYVTLVAQREPLGEVKQALVSVTDSTHLDRTPWMRPVDVVDAEASNRASVLFEMRGQHSRQFALYRVIGARADQVFETGTTE